MSFASRAFAVNEAINVTNTVGSPLIPVVPPLTVNAVEGVGMVDAIVARFTDEDAGARAADYTVADPVLPSVQYDGWCSL